MFSALALVTAAGFFAQQAVRPWWHGAPPVPVEPDVVVEQVQPGSYFDLVIMNPSKRSEEYLAEKPSSNAAENIQSSISQLPFLTNFNTGQGPSYYRFGQKVSDENWNHLSQQDVSLSYSHDTDEKDGGVYAEESYDFAYHGGSSLALYGTPNQNQTIDLFKTCLAITKPTELRLVIGAGEKRTSAEISVSFELESGQREEFLLRFPKFQKEQSETKQWQVLKIDLASLVGQYITKISLSVTPRLPSDDDHLPQNSEEAILYIGELRIHETGKNTSAPRIGEVKLNLAQGRGQITWDRQDDCDYFEVFGRTIDGPAEFYLGRAYTNFYAYRTNLMNPTLTSNLSFGSFRVVCVNKYGERS